MQYVTIWSNLHICITFTTDTQGRFLIRHAIRYHMIRFAYITFATNTLGHCFLITCATTQVTLLWSVFVFFILRIYTEYVQNFTFISRNIWIIVRQHCTGSFTKDWARSHKYVYLITSLFLFSQYNIIPLITPMFTLQKTLPVTNTYLCEPKYITQFVPHCVLSYLPRFTSSRGNVVHSV